MISLQNMSRYYGALCAVNNISFDIPAGSIAGLLGQNGAGKSTLLNVISGYLSPTKGTVLVDGADTVSDPVKARKSVGYLPEIPPLYDEMSVREFLEYAALLKQVNRNEVKEHCKALMSKTDLTLYKDKLISHLSKGTRQRVGIAYALCGNPSIMLLDEPTNGLDPKQITEIRALIASLKKDHTILFSSHILSEVEQLCDRVLILHNGTLKADTADFREKMIISCDISGDQKTVLKEIRKSNFVTNVYTQNCPFHATRYLIEYSTWYTDETPELDLIRIADQIHVRIIHMQRSDNNLESLFMQSISE